MVFWIGCGLREVVADGGSNVHVCQKSQSLSSFNQPMELVVVQADA